MCEANNDVGTPIISVVRFNVQGKWSYEYDVYSSDDGRLQTKMYMLYAILYTVDSLVVSLSGWGEKKSFQIN